MRIQAFSVALRRQDSVMEESDLLANKPGVQARITAKTRPGHKRNEARMLPVQDETKIVYLVRT